MHGIEIVSKEMMIFCLSRGEQQIELFKFEKMRRPLLIKFRADQMMRPVLQHLDGGH